MNAVPAPYTIALNYQVPRQLNRTNVAIGIVLSLLMHFAFVAWSLQHNMEVKPAKLEERPIAVRLMPPPVVRPLVQQELPPPPQPKEVEKEKAAKPATQAKVKATPAPAINIITSTNTNKPAPDANTVAPQVPAPEKHIDMGAMQANIKSALAQVDREHGETPSGQLVAKPLYPPEEGTKMGKMIDGTTRADCKEQVAAMGLLAPLGVLMTLKDKKDNGCKWR